VLRCTPIALGVCFRRIETIAEGVQGEFASEISPLRFAIQWCCLFGGYILYPETIEWE